MMCSRVVVWVIVALVVFGTAACEPDGGGESARWETVFAELPAALLGVWGTSADDVWTVGADAGDGPYVLHFDGDTWTRKASGQRGTLWWVWGNATRLWMAGEAGLVLRYDRAADRFTRIEGVPANVTLYGIFELPSGDVWTVGGNSSGGRVFKLSGSTFAEETVPAEAAEAGRFFKVWGRSATDLWVVGVGDKMLYRDGSGWQVFDTPRGGRLTTVHGNSSQVVAVGGFTEGLVVDASSSGPVDASPSGVSPLNGVWVQTDGTVVAVGAAGTVIERRGSVWRTPNGVPGSLDDYHAVYVDPAGGVWAVGGFLLVEPQRRGMLLHYGLPISRTIE